MARIMTEIIRFEIDRRESDIVIFCHLAVGQIKKLRVSKVTRSLFYEGKS
jgi:hypothetical protein